MPRRLDTAGQLTEISATSRTPEEWSWYGEFEAQVMGWLGDGDSYHADQAALLAAATFSYQTGSASDRHYVERLAQGVLESLEDRGFAIAASPFRLTDRGHRARLTGLNSRSVRRLEAALPSSYDGWLAGLEGVTQLSPEQALKVAQTVFESTETMAKSLWLRRELKTSAAMSEYLDGFARGEYGEHFDSEVFQAEVHAVSQWLAGSQFSVIAEAMPTFGGSGLFGSSNEASRVSDVAEYVSRIGYPGSWTWSGVHVLAKHMHDLPLPSWIAAALEYGASTETAVSLMRLGSISRPGAVSLSEELGPSWPTALERLSQSVAVHTPLTTLDRERLRNLRRVL